MKFILTLFFFLATMHLIAQTQFSQKYYIDQVDSIIHYDTLPQYSHPQKVEREIYEYNYLGLVSSYTKYNNRPNAAYKIEKNTYEYNFQEQLIATRTWVKRDTDTAMVERSKVLYTYDGLGNVLIKESFQRDLNNSTAVMIPTCKDSNIYNTNNLRDSIFFFSWDNTNNSYFLWAIMTYGYNTNNQITSFADFTPHYGGYFQQYHMISYYYNTQNNLSDINAKYYNSNTGVFEVQSIWSYDYDSDQNLIQHKRQHPFYPLANGKTTYTHDTNGDFMQATHYTINNVTNQYEVSTIDTYNRNGLKPISEVAQMDNVLHFKLPTYIIKPMIPQTYRVDTVTSRNPNKNQVVAYKTYHYGPFNPVNIAHSEAVKAKVYPNPTHEYIKFDLDNIDMKGSISIYDINGKQIKSSAIDSNIKIDVSELSSGMYFYLIQTQNQAITGKFVKQ